MELIAYGDFEQTGYTGLGVQGVLIWILLGAGVREYIPLFSSLI